jgi:tetratricopeptide (TPR) repeat protein
MVVTLPVIMILLDYWPLGRFESKKENLISWQLREKMPFFVLSAIFSIITIYAQYEQSFDDIYIPMSSLFANASVSFVIYLEKTFWPHNMAVFYPFPFQIPAGQVIGASLLIILISAAVIVMAKRMPYLFVGWMWYAIAIAPVIGIIQIGDSAMADRYHYLPSVGIAVMLTWGIPSLIKNEDIRKKILSPVAIAVLAILAFITWQQSGYWRNSTELLNHALRVTKNNYLAHNNLGIVLFDKGTLKEALYHFNEAIRSKADYAFAYNNRGAAYYNLGQYQLAIKDFTKVINLKPDSAGAYNNRAFTYLNHGDKNIGCRDAKKACELGNCEASKRAKSKGYCR